MHSETYTLGNRYKVPVAVLLPAGQEYRDRENGGVLKSNGLYGLYAVPLSHTHPHDDTEFIKFDIEHYHIDWRFVPNRIFLYAIDHTSPYAAIITKNQVVTIEYRWRKMIRDYWPYPHEKAKWIPELEAEYAEKKLVKGHICPHKGYDFTHHPIDKNGCVTCPWHGLQWKTDTGRLVSRKEVGGEPV